MGGWLVFTNEEDGMAQTVPENDIVMHDVDEPWDCVCGPTVEQDGHVFYHHPLDGRPRMKRFSSD